MDTVKRAYDIVRGCGILTVDETDLLFWRYTPEEVLAASPDELYRMFVETRILFIETCYGTPEKDE